jgi:hypothetical protein
VQHFPFPFSQKKKRKRKHVVPEEKEKWQWMIRRGTQKEPRADTPSISFTHPRSQRDARVLLHSIRLACPSSSPPPAGREGAWKRQRLPAMAAPLVLVGLPLGLLFLLSGLIVNTIQVASPGPIEARSA